jgi:hypothetical protein
MLFIIVASLLPMLHNLVDRLPFFSSRYGFKSLVWQLHIESASQPVRVKA